MGVGARGGRNALAGDPEPLQPAEVAGWLVAGPRVDVSQCCVRGRWAAPRWPRQVMKFLCNITTSSSSSPLVGTALLHLISPLAMILAREIGINNQV